MKTMTYHEWLAEGKRLFGEDFFQWRFECPVCHNIAAVSDFEQHKEKCATPDSATKECIGRYQDRKYRPFSRSPLSKDEAKVKQPCDYAGYGLKRLSPVVIERDGQQIHCFAFAAPEAHVTHT